MANTPYVSLSLNRTCIVQYPQWYSAQSCKPHELTTDEPKGADAVVKVRFTPPLLNVN